MLRARRSSRTLFRALAPVVGALGLVLSITPGVARAHTALDYTLPAADETLAEPVSVITVAFTDAVTPVGAGFEVFTPAGEVVQPEVFTEDGTVYLLQLDPPLAGGDVGVRYEVTSADGHIVGGSFAFTVLATPVSSAPTTAVPAPATAAPPPAVTAPTASPVTTAPPPATAQTVDQGPADASGDTTPASVIAALPADEAGSDGGGSTGLVIGVVAAIVIAAGAVVVVLRARRSTDVAT